MYFTKVVEIGEYAIESYERRLSWSVCCVAVPTETNHQCEKLAIIESNVAVCKSAFNATYTKTYGSDEVETAGTPISVRSSAASP